MARESQRPRAHAQAPNPYIYFMPQPQFYGASINLTQYVSDHSVALNDGQITTPAVDLDPMATDEQNNFQVLLLFATPVVISSFTLHMQTTSYLDEKWFPLGGAQCFAMNGTLLAQTGIVNVTGTISEVIEHAPPPVAPYWGHIDYQLANVPGAGRNIYIFQSLVSGSGDDDGISPAPFTSCTLGRFAEIDWVI